VKGRSDPLRRAIAVVHALTVSDIRMRYGRGRLRAVKWLLDPYAVTGVYLLLVAYVLDRPGPSVGLSIACAIVPFQLVVMSIVNASSAVHARRSIVSNMRFERGLIPLASVVTETVGFAAALTLLAVMMAVYGVAPTAALLWLPVLLGGTFLLAVAAAYPAALIGLWYPNARPFMVSLARAAFFVAPGFVALDQIHGEAREWLRLNPLSGIFESYRSVFVTGSSPAAWELLVPFAVALLVLALLVPVFRREAPHLAKVME
jgi:ABC-type polysaccharide/polyol phosphate export permease